MNLGLLLEVSTTDVSSLSSVWDVLTCIHSFPAVKRLMKEAQELREPTEQYFAQPLEVGMCLSAPPPNPQWW